MATAFLFNPPPEPDNYAEWAIALSLASGLPQQDSAPVHVLDGDLLWYIACRDSWDPVRIGTRLDETNAKPGLLKQPLKSTLGQHRVHVVYFPDLDDVLATKLHTSLLHEERYMGCYGVNQSLGLHYVLFDCNLVLSYRIAGDECLVKYSESMEMIRSLDTFRFIAHAPLGHPGSVYEVFRSGAL